MTSLTNISPIDGRYQNQVSELGQFFSESSLARNRVRVEVSYLISLSSEKKIKELKRFDSQTTKQLNNLWQKFSAKDAQRIKQIEKTTNHDVKAVEYFIKEKTKRLKFNQEFIHFALTSEDINNLAHTLQFKEALTNVYLPALDKLLKNLQKLAKANKNIGMLALTHGQPATPTTLGKELAVFCFRLKRQINSLKNQKFYGKLNGASGCWAAHQFAYPPINWLQFSRKFVESLGLKFNPLTTQIESHDSLAESYDNIRRINNILIDFNRDIWFYISRGVFKQKVKKGEVGSSTMPHKVNPINFENSEGNLGIANALLNFLSNKLTISRMQRDLTDSTVIRNQGVALAHSLLGIKSILKGLDKLQMNKKVIQFELDNNSEVLAEAIQTILRKAGHPKPYEKLKELTRGKKIDQQTIKEFIQNLDINEDEKTKLLKLKPESYIGLAGKLVDKFI
jgi:adenylosuccinate lyase